MKFTELNLLPEILRAIEDAGYTKATPIQEKAIPLLLDGKDLIGCAQTGTGKTAAFSIPTLQKLNQEGHKGYIRSLILTPTRELAAQIMENIEVYGKYLPLQSAVIFGGVSQKSQEKAIPNADILVATPGRLLDLMKQKIVNLSRVQILILDEADRMLDMGFLNDVKRIIHQIPEKRQTLLFSATMPKEIKKLAQEFLYQPVNVEVTPISSTVDTISQELYYVSKSDKRKVLVHLLRKDVTGSALIFTRTKNNANRVVKFLEQNHISACAIHGNKSQNARVLALNSFKKGEIRILVATDIAARGIDIDELSCVINYEIPNIAETYVHRIGRTGRAGLKGRSISLCDGEEKAYIKDIERLIHRSIPVRNLEINFNHISIEEPIKKVRTLPRRKTSEKDKKSTAHKPKANHGYGSTNKKNNFANKKSKSKGNPQFHSKKSA
ncbi:MAG: DEAD/DEAH box helicase [Erysipelotrichaceae bacterium]